MPLSIGDIAHILFYKNERKMIATTNKHLYIIEQTEKTPVITNWKQITKKWDAYSKKTCDTMFKQIETGELKMLQSEAWRNAIIKTNEKMAKEYYMKYKIIKRK